MVFTYIDRVQLNTSHKTLKVVTFVTTSFSTYFDVLNKVVIKMKSYLLEVYVRFLPNSVYIFI